MGMQPVRVGISGSYGGLNLGDEAVLEVMDRQLRASVPAEITVFRRDVDPVIVAGRCISRTHEADSSYRAMPISTATGQAAGVCAALAAHLRKRARDIPAREVRTELIRQGANLGR